VVRNGEVLKAKGYGLANVELGVAATPDTIYQSGSVGKQFTATLAMMLIEEGKLGLDDPVSKYLPSAPPAWQGITLRHLLTHTSGISNSIYQRINMRQDYTEDELLQQIMSMPLDFQPGEKWNYSNAGYVTLGILIHKAAGKFYGDLLREKIFGPLGMTTARVISEADIVPNRAAGYRLVDGQLKNQEWVSPTLNTTADGALYLTVLDLAKWDAALYTEKLLKRSSLDLMWTPVKLNDGKTEPYGFGWGLSDVRGHHVISHGGAWQGFTMSIARYVDDKLTVIVMTNLDAAHSRPERIGKGIAGIYNAELGPVVHQAVKIDPKIFDAYVGDYALTPEVTLSIAREGDRLWGGPKGQDRRELLAESETRFFFDDSETEITFVKDANGKVTHLIVHQNGGMEARKIR
jgi:CubicO group peptidase (beta-lactamase class C family)